MLLERQTHQLICPSDRDTAKATAILEGRYELPKIPDLVKARRILDIGADVGAFAAWCHYVWPHAWIDCYEANEQRAGYCKQNAPPGTLTHHVLVTPELVRELPVADVLRVNVPDLAMVMANYPHLPDVSVLIIEWSDNDQHGGALVSLALSPFVLASARVDHIGAGCEVWVRSDAVYEPATEQHVLLSGEVFEVGESGTDSPTFCLGLPHTPWRDDRVASMARLMRELASMGDLGPPGMVLESRCFAEQEPNHSWSAKMWRWALSTKASHFVTLQDDARVAPNFWLALSAMVQANPSAIIGLEAVHPAIPFLAARGQRWCETRAWLVGVGYLMPRQDLAELLMWRAKQPVWRIMKTNEDTLINDFCVETRRRVMHPIPTIVDHDTSIASTYDNDTDTHRRPTVRWVDGKKYGFALEWLADRHFWDLGKSTHLEMPKEVT